MGPWIKFDRNEIFRPKVGPWWDPSLNWKYFDLRQDLGGTLDKIDPRSDPSGTLDKLG